ncbi:MAG: regulatory protein RecX [Gammaproteobacteria bacterium]
MGDEFNDIRQVALRLLAQREHSRLELLKKLTFRGFEGRQVEEVIAELVEQGWLSDQRFAENYARQRLQKGYGPIRISHELRQAGIDSFDLEKTIAETTESWLTLLIRVYEKKYPQDQTLTRHEWAKRSRFLSQRGFTGALISALFDHLNLKFE